MPDNLARRAENLPSTPRALGLPGPIVHRVVPVLSAVGARASTVRIGPSTPDSIGAEHGRPRPPQRDDGDDGPM